MPRASWDNPRRRLSLTCSSQPAVTQTFPSPLGFYNYSFDTSQQQHHSPNVSARGHSDGHRLAWVPRGAELPCQLMSLRVLSSVPSYQCRPALAPSAVIWERHNALGKVLIIPRGGLQAAGAELGLSWGHRLPGPLLQGQELSRELSQHRAKEKEFSQCLGCFFIPPTPFSRARLKHKKFPPSKIISAACLETVGLELTGDLIFVSVF